MDKGFLENSDLSWKAKGILAYLLSKPDNWKVVIKDLVNNAKDGKSAVYSGLTELKTHGHYEKKPIRDKDNRRILHWEGTISELPTVSRENGDVRLLTDFQEVENQDIENQDIENRERNNNYLSNNKGTHNQSSPVCPTGQTERIRANIDYDNLAQTHPEDMPLVDEFVAVIVDSLLTDASKVRIGGEEKPRTLVNSQLLKLDYNNIAHAIDQYKGITERITKKRQYILTMLYSCRLEQDAHYTNAVRADMAKGVKKWT